ncbi:hypothetical protein RRG08_048636 [Elysia crispata]|uniref:Uncharacterized protein n=1 Tax=Elysia crispata TaxID=231223 RepID=A0AAE1AF24_9GAST|nr:hypothetical protein RRG08_048636 [Elysia crispata]
MDSVFTNCLTFRRITKTAKSNFYPVRLSQLPIAPGEESNCQGSTQPCGPLLLTVLAPRLSVFDHGTESLRWQNKTGKSQHEVRTATTGQCPSTIRDDVTVSTDTCHWSKRKEYGSLATDSSITAADVGEGLASEMVSVERGHCVT